FRPPPPAPPAPPIQPIVATVPPIAAAATDAEMTAAGRAWSRTLSDRETAAIAAYKGDLGKVLNAALRRSQGGVPRLYAPVVEDLDAAIGRSKAPRALTVFRGVKDLAWLRGKVVGDRGELAGYTSTSIRRRVAKTFRGDGLLVIDVPEGYPAAYVHHLAPTGKAQFELLVARGARYEIVEIGDREFRLRILP
ncbi:MAG: ADP-ribosyltransferase, partial [Siculibacillus sp.]